MEGVAVAVVPPLQQADAAHPLIIFLVAEPVGDEAPVVADAPGIATSG